MTTKIRWALGVLTTAAFFWLGVRMMSVEPRVGALLLAFGLLRGTLVGRQIWTEWTAERAAAAGQG